MSKELGETDVKQAASIVSGERPPLGEASAAAVTGSGEKDVASAGAIAASDSGERSGAGEKAAAQVTAAQKATTRKSAGEKADAPAETLEEFRARVFLAGRELYRDLPWRRTCDPYAIWVSEAMLQQTQVSRVDGRWQSWLERFPSVDALAAASSADVLAEWQGLGYNRRALALWKAAQQVCEAHAGQMPTGEAELRALPGIGPATAAGIRAFAYDAPGVYLETNVRTVFLHELFAEAHDVPDSALVPLVRDACPGSAQLETPVRGRAAKASEGDESLPAPGECDEAGVSALSAACGGMQEGRAPAMSASIEIPGTDVLCTPRSWYYALLDYGAYLKKTVPNPSRRSRSNVRQSKFEGSHRQKRAAVLRLLLAVGEEGLAPADAAAALTSEELAAGRDPVSQETAAAILAELATEGFCHETPSGVYVA